jgi:hypothetical protein
MTRKIAASLSLALALAAAACEQSRSQPEQAQKTVGFARSQAAPSASAARPPMAMRVSPGGGRTDVADDVAPSAEALPTPEADLSSTAVANSSGRPAVPPPQPGEPSQSVAPAMLIRTGTATIEVDSLEPAIVRLRLVAQRLGGFVANSSLQSGHDQQRSATLELKVPASRFDDALSGLRPIGKVEAQNIEAEDVSEEYVDMAARMTNARRLESRLIDLLANRTGKLQDVLSVERELARVREEIERYEGRLRYLKTRASISTLTVTIHEPSPIVARAEGRSPIAEAFRESWRNFVGFFAGFIAMLGVLIPLGAIGVAIWWLVRRFRWRAPQAAQSGSTSPAQTSKA